MEKDNANSTKKLEDAISYNEHAILMSKIAINLLTENIDILNKKGIKELISMYLLIPYITNKQLDKPDEKYYNIPKLDINSIFAKVKHEDNSVTEATLDAIRNALCHSFVSLTDQGDILLDDRASYDRNTHNSLTDKGFCNRFEIKKTRQRLLTLHMDVIKQQQEFVKNYYYNRTFETSIIKGFEISQTLKIEKLPRLDSNQQPTG